MVQIINTILRGLSPQELVAPRAKVLKPAAYWVPRQWNDVIDRLRAHGIQMETIQEPKELEVEMYGVHAPKISKEPFEEHVNVIGTFAAEHRVEKFLPGLYEYQFRRNSETLFVLCLSPLRRIHFLAGVSSSRSFRRQNTLKLT
jgi:hypothetical protein